MKIKMIKGIVSKGKDFSDVEGQLNSFVRIHNVLDIKQSIAATGEGAALLVYTVMYDDINK